VPLVNREGMEIQVKEALARKQGSTLKIKDVIDDSVITELDKEVLSTSFTDNHLR
jgi:hypothetical protein